MSRYSGISKLTKMLVGAKSAARDLKQYESVVTLAIEAKVSGADEIEIWMDKLAHLLHDLRTLGEVGARAVQQQIIDRATNADVGFLYTAVQNDANPDFFTGEMSASARQPAIDQFSSQIIPLLGANPVVLSQGHGQVSISLVNFEALAKVHITEVIEEVRPKRLTKKQARLMKTANDEFEMIADPEAMALQGGLFDKRYRLRTTTTKSNYIETWQIVEFGTGIFARHPSWGWGPRLENDPGQNTKVPGGQGSWLLNPNATKPPYIEVFGQAGGHFLFEQGADGLYALSELAAAVKAIKDKLDEAMGFGETKTVRRPAGS